MDFERIFLKILILDQCESADSARRMFTRNLLYPCRTRSNTWRGAGILCRVGLQSRTGSFRLSQDRELFSGLFGMERTGTGILYDWRTCMAIKVTSVGCAATGLVPCQRNTRRLLSELMKTFPQQKQVSSWRHISCHTDKNRYYT